MTTESDEPNDHPSPPDAESVDFETALAKLEAVVQALERGDLGLSASLEQYEQGVQCVRQCERALSQAEGRIEQLFRIDDEGRALVKPFEHEQPTDASTAGRRTAEPD